jgi:glucokinase
MSQPLLLGIEIGGTKLQLGLGRGDGRLVALERRAINPRAGAAGILDQIKEAYSTLRDRSGLNSADAVAGVGVGYGGPVDVASGRVVRSYQVEGWDDFPLADWLIGNLAVPRAEVQNDADTAGLAEARFGAGRGLSPILYVTVGSGIGGALIVDGQIYRGAGRGAAEIGHLAVAVESGDGLDLRELEQVASGWGIGRQGEAEARRLLGEGRGDWGVLHEAGGDPSRISAALIARHAVQRDPIAARILDQARQAIAFALQQAIALLAPRRIIVGGGVSLIGEAEWHEPIRRLVDRDVFEPFRLSYDIMPPALGEEVVVHGAIALASDAPIRQS